MCNLFKTPVDLKLKAYLFDLKTPPDLKAFGFNQIFLYYKTPPDLK